MTQIEHTPILQCRQPGLCWIHPRRENSTPRAHTISVLQSPHNLTTPEPTQSHYPRAHTISLPQSPHNLSTPEPTQSQYPRAHTISVPQSPHNLSTPEPTQSHYPRAHTISLPQSPHNLTTPEPTQSQHSRAHTISALQSPHNLSTPEPTQSQHSRALTISVLQSPYNLNTPEPIIPEPTQSQYPRARTVKLGRITMWKNPHQPQLHCKPSLITLIRPLRPDVSRTFWCYSGVPQMPNLLKISLDVENYLRNGFFSIWRIDLKVEWNFWWPLSAKFNENAFDAAMGCSNVWQHPAALINGENCAVGHESMVKIGKLMHLSVWRWIHVCSITSTILTTILLFLVWI